jgi:hypothetical protein
VLPEKFWSKVAKSAPDETRGDGRTWVVTSVPKRDLLAREYQWSACWTAYLAERGL